MHGSTWCKENNVLYDANFNRYSFKADRAKDTRVSHNFNKTAVIPTGKVDASLGLGSKH